jgi:alpha-tubulin suppressor-like RCC1 family protein
VTGIAAGGNHTCAVIDLDDVKCWGHNAVGQLGQGHILWQGDNAGEMGIALATTDIGTGRSATAITAGIDHSCALLDDVTVKCWGRNSFGQLGQSQLGHLGDGAGEMGDALPRIDVGTQNALTAVATGVAHTCAILDNGTVKCWGENASGQLGLGDTSDRGDGLGEMGAVLPAVNLGNGRTATAIAAGNVHTCAILDTGAVKCWGENGTGQLGQGAHPTAVTAPARWGTTSPRSTSALGAPQRQSRRVAGTPARCSMMAKSSVGGRTARVSSPKATR